MMTEAQHAQLVDALSTRDVRLHESALAMLKAMQPVVVAKPKKAKHKIKPKFKAGVFKIRED